MALITLAHMKNGLHQEQSIKIADYVSIRATIYAYLIPPFQKKLVIYLDSTFPTFRTFPN